MRVGKGSDEPISIARTELPARGSGDPSRRSLFEIDMVSCFQWARKSDTRSLTGPGEEQPAPFNPSLPGERLIDGELSIRRLIQRAERGLPLNLPRMRGDS